MIPITVTELNERVKSLLDRDEVLQNMLVRGELSNYKIYGSGHHYFVLKDADSTVRCVMFKGQASKLKFAPKDGMQAMLTGRVSVYPRDGAYQLYVNEIIPDGVGDLAMAFEQLKEKLHAEGLFDRKHKKPLPRMPLKVALVTSPTGAVVHDMLQIIARRWPLCKVLICPVRVQGVEAPGEIVAAIETLNRLRAVDLMIVGRGGGSLEDLWAFNDERLARAIFASNIPVVSAVGHEPDVTIADFVADVRASTPSHAAEIITPDKLELRAGIQAQLPRMGESLRRRVQDGRLRLDVTIDKMQSVVERKISESRNKITAYGNRLDALSPLRVLDRGYAIALGSDGKAVRSVQAVSKGDSLTLRVSDGEIEAKVEGVIS